MQRLAKDYLNGAVVPEEWKEAWISVIHKKGKKEECGNYGGLSVTSTFSYLYRTIIKKKIEEE